MAVNDKVRLNLELSPSVREKLDELQRRNGAASVTEVIRRALVAFDCITEYTGQGWEVVLRDPASGKEKILKLI